MEYNVTKEEVSTMSVDELTGIMDDIAHAIDNISYSLESDFVVEGSYIYMQYMGEINEYQRMYVMITKELVRRGQI